MVGQQFLRGTHGLDVTPILLELNRTPHLWGRDPGRQLYAGSPHQAVQDGWVRFAVRQNDLASIANVGASYPGPLNPLS